MDLGIARGDFGQFAEFVVLVLHVGQLGQVFLDLLGSLFQLRLRLDAHREDDARHFVADVVQQAAEQLERLALVFLLRVLLRIAAQVDALAQVVQRRQMLAPVRIQALQHHRALEAGKGLAADLRHLARIHSLDGLLHLRQQLFVLDRLRLLHRLHQRHLDAPVVTQRLLQAGEIPLLFHGLGRHVGAEQLDEHGFAQVLDQIARVDGFENFVAQLVDLAALVVGHVVVLQQLLADVEVAALDLALRGLDRARDDARLDRLAFRHLQAVHDGAHAIAGEDAQQLIVERQVEARRARIALAAGAAAQLVVDPARLMALGADDMQTARGLDLLVQRLPLVLQLRDAPGLLFVRQGFVGHHEAGLLFHIAAQHDVGTTARHVGGDGDHLGPAGLRDDLGLARVLLGVEHLVRQLGLVQQVRQQLGVLDGSRAHQHRLAALEAVADIADDGVVALLRGLVDLVLQVLALGLPVGRDHHRLQAVDLLELVGFGIGRAGHARQLGVHAEVVLEGDGRQRLVFLLDLHAFLGLHGLVQAVGPAAALHQAAGEFVDDDHLVALHHVVLVAVEQAVRAQGGVQVVHQRDVLRRVQRFALGQQARLQQDLLRLLVPRFGQVDLVGFFIDVVVARLLDAGAVGLLFADLAREQRRDAVHAAIQVGVVLGLAGDDQRRAGFIDQDRVHLVDDGVVQRTLHALAVVVHHVVAQVVEAELVVGTVGDVGSVGGLLLIVGHGGQVDPDRQAQPVVELAHPFGIALGQVVVDRHHVHAQPGDRIQVDRQRGGQRLAFASAHFGDLAIVQHHAADQLHVEMAHLHHALAGFATHGECFGQQHIEGLALGEALAECLGLGLQFGIGKRLERGFERVDLHHLAAVLFDQPFVAAAENLLEKARDHRWQGPACHPSEGSRNERETQAAQRPEKGWRKGGSLACAKPRLDGGRPAGCGRNAALRRGHIPV